MKKIIMVSLMLLFSLVMISCSEKVTEVRNNIEEHNRKIK